MARTQTLTARVWKEGDVFVSRCLEVNVSSYGETEDEALEMLREALELYLEGDEEIPEFHRIEVNLPSSRRSLSTTDGITAEGIYRNGTLTFRDPPDFENNTILKVTVRGETEQEIRNRDKVIRESFGVLKDLVDWEQFQKVLLEHRERQAQP